MTTDSSSRHLTRRYVFTVGFILLLILLGLIALGLITNVQGDYDSLIQLSGRQRTLAQGIALSAQSWAHSPTEAGRAEWRQRMQDQATLMEQTHEHLRNGLLPPLFPGLPSLSSDSLQAIYQQPTQLDSQVRAYLNTAKSLLSAPQGVLSPAQPELQELISSSLTLSKPLEAVVEQYKLESQNLLNWLRIIGFSALGLMMLAIGGAWLFIFRPLAQRFDQEALNLAESRRQMDMVLLTVGEAIITMDIHSRVLRTNQEVTHIWGYTPEELAGKRLDMLLAPQYREKHSDASDVRTMGKRLEIEGVRKDGSIFPMEMRITKAVFGNEFKDVLLTGAFRDITTRKLAEAKIQHQLETIQALYASTQKLSASLNLEMLAADITRTCVEIFGARLAWLGRAEDDGSVRLIEQSPASSRLPQQLVVYWHQPLDTNTQEPIGRAIRSGAPVIDQDFANQSDAHSWRKAAQAHSFESMAAFPLVSRDRPYGALSLYHDHSDFFTSERVEFFHSYALQAAAALENARLFAEDRRRLDRMQALRSVDAAIRSSLDLSVTLNILLDQVLSRLQVDAAAVMLLDQQMQTLEHAANRGFLYPSIARSRLRLGKGHAGQAALTRHLVSISNLTEHPDDPMRTPLLAGEGFISYYAMPLLAKGQVKGVLEIFQRDTLTPNSDWLEFLEALAAQAAIALDNATLLSELQHSNDELKVAYDGTLEGWSRALDLRDSDTEGHTMRVTHMAVQLAYTLGLSQEEIVQIHRGSLLHDIGKMGVPDSILRKPGKLTDEEWSIMRKHPQYAYDMLYPIKFLRTSLDIPYCHHEKWDGSGYPRGLKGDQIPLSARIFAVVDVWDALSSDRPYHKAWMPEKVREHIQQLSGTHFDPQVVGVFLRLLRGE